MHSKRSLDVYVIITPCTKLPVHVIPAIPAIESLCISAIGHVYGISIPDSFKCVYTACYRICS